MFRPIRAELSSLCTVVEMNAEVQRLGTPRSQQGSKQDAGRRMMSKTKLGEGILAICSLISERSSI